MRDIYKDRGGARSRVLNLNNEPAPTIMAEGIGGIGHGQYHLEQSTDRKSSASSKPPYRVPPMAEIAAVPKNGYKIVSTFAGTGGSCLGYRMAGFSVLWANEFEPNAVECHRLNFSDCILDTRDIRVVMPKEILAATGIKAGELDLLDGSPPCQSFSTAGKRERHWGKVVAHGDGTTQRSDDLFSEYARILRGLMPKVFIAENVSGLVKGVAKGYFKAILAELKSCGYLVEARLLDAQWLGVPQMRQRIIFVGVRNDLGKTFGVKPEFPAPLPHRYSVLEAIGDLIKNNEKPEKPEKPPPTVTSHICADTGFNLPLRVEVRHGGGFGAEKWRDASRVPAQTVGAGPASGNNLHNNAHAIRFIEDAGGFGKGEFTGPSPTIRSARAASLQVDYSRGQVGPGSKWKPQNRKLGPSESRFTIVAADGGKEYLAITENSVRRKFTIAELRRICSFPDDFILVGSYQKQWARLGNSVPPIMAAAIASAIRDKILAKIPA